MSGKKSIGVLLAAAIVLITALAAVGGGSAASGDTTYNNGNLNFSLTLPASWAGLYRAEESSDGVAFINIRNEKAGCGGHLFGILVAADTGPAEWGAKELTRDGGRIYYASFPSDVQYEHNNASLTKEYARMQKDIGSIVKTFRLGSSTRR